MGFALDYQHVGAALLGEVVGHAGTYNAAADDYDFSCFGHSCRD